MTDELFEQYKNLVYYSYKKLEKTKFVLDNKDDLIQEGFLALINAINSYEEYRTVALSTYIMHFIKYRMWRWIIVNSRPYTWTNVDITDTEWEHLAAIDDNIDNLEEFVANLLNDYRYYLTHYRSKKTNIDNWVDRAEIIIEQYIKNGKKMTARKLEEDFCIGRTLVTNTLRDLRKVLTLKLNNKLYKEEPVET